MGFKKSSIWISGPQIVPYQIRQNVFNLKSTLVRIIRGIIITSWIKNGIILGNYYRITMTIHG